eukprot:624115-Rhodomonas_salina.1
MQQHGKRARKRAAVQYASGECGADDTHMPTKRVADVTCHVTSTPATSAHAPGKKQASYSLDIALDFALEQRVQLPEIPRPSAILCSYSGPKGQITVPMFINCDASNEV